ncbi:MAG: DNA helicase RecQ [Bacteroidota bacterium]|nr:DNA helicase RecQ [Bacteroidota bacterium]
MNSEVSPLKILKTQFGFNDFRLDQKQIIDTVLKKNDAFVLMPTGGGKSLCYQIPALIFEGVTIVISPLIALMKDQVDALRIAGISAEFLNSSLSNQEQSIIVNKLQKGTIKILYLAPERLFGGTHFIDFLKQISVSLFAIDEAHCISQWGHDFRPEYLLISKLKVNFPDVPVIALTATADHLTRKDILQKLNLNKPRTFISSFNRPNIHYYIEPKSKSFQRLLSFLEAHANESGIIYVLSRSSAENLAEDLRKEGYSVKPYHAGLNKNLREKHQDQFIKDEVKIIVATIAFGMGIDKSNVRFVVHMDLPKNIEGYYQETGRAGRDGLKSEALLFYSYGDVIKLRSFAEVENNPKQSAIMLEKLEKMAEFCQSRNCRRNYLLKYFGEESPQNCGSCDVCLTHFETFDGTIIAQKAFSALVRLKESFGMNYIIDFLRGSNSSVIKEHHRELKTFSVGKDISKKDWQIYFRDFIDTGYLKVEGKFPVLKLTDRSWKVLRGEEQVFLKKNKTVEEAVEAKNLPHEENLLKHLKSIRYDIANKENVPAYIIFSDATLLELATYLPHNYDELKKISGMGEIKISKYGHTFLVYIQNYCKENILTSKINLKPSERKSKSRSKSSSAVSASKDSKNESLDMFKSGLSIKEIANRRALTHQTIEGHLAHFVLHKKINIEEIVSEEKFPKIKEAIMLHGDVALGPIKHELGNDFSYGEIIAVINHLKAENSK